MEKISELLKLAKEENNTKEKKRLIEECLLMDPDSIEALLLKTTLIKNSYDRLKAIDAVFYKVEEQMILENSFDIEDLGDFYVDPVTRPFVLTLVEKIKALNAVQFYFEAKHLSIVALRLDRNDTLCVRDLLMNSLLHLNDIDSAEMLYLDHDEEDRLEMILPLCVLRYVNHELKEAEELLDLMSEDNFHLLTLFSEDNKEMDSEDFELGSIEHFSKVLDSMVNAIPVEFMNWVVLNQNKSRVIH